VNGALPAWARAAAFLGAPTVIALYLVYYVTQSLGAELVAHGRDTERLLAVLTQVCRNVAPTNVDRDRCDQLAWGWTLKETR
jgi:hypothetical protein